MSVSVCKMSSVSLESIYTSTHQKKNNSVHRQVCTKQKRSDNFSMFLKMQLLEKYLWWSSGSSKGWLHGADTLSPVRREPHSSGDVQVTSPTLTANFRRKKKRLKAEWSQLKLADGNITSTTFLVKLQNVDMMTMTAAAYEKRDQLLTFIC